MNEKEFASDVLGCKILTTEEVFEMLKYFNSVNSLSVGFSEKERTGTTLSCCRFTGLEKFWYYSSDDAIDFQVDREIQLHGVQMFGSEIGDHIVILRIINTNTPYDPVCAKKSGKFSSTHIQFQSTFYYGYDVLFDSPVKIEKDVKFRLLAVIDGPASLYGIDGSSSVQCHGVTFSFFDVDRDKECTYVPTLCNDTDVENGQFAEFLFKVD